MDNQFELEESAGFDYKAFFVKLLMFWPWILGFLAASMVVCYFYIQTLTPQYTVNSSVLIKHEKGNHSMNGMEELGFVTTSTQLFENEIEILRARSLMRKAVISRDLYITYSYEGRYRNHELYNNTPVKVWMTPEEAEKMGYAGIEMTTDGTSLDVEIKVGKNTYSKHFDTLPAVFTTPAGVFSFTADKNVNPEALAGKKILASVVSPTSMAASYKGALNVEAFNKAASIASLTLVTSNIERGKDFLTALVNVYNSDANDDKNEVASKTAEFIDERIRLINSELGTTESELAAFKQKAGVVDLASDASMAATERSAYEKAYADNETQVRLLGFIKSYLMESDKEYAVIPSNIGLSNQNLGTLIERYNEMLLERSRLLRTSSETNPSVLTLNDGISILRDNIRLVIETEEKTLQITKAELERQTAKFDTKVQNAPVQEKEFLSIARQQEIKANLYLMLLQKREENSITLASTANNARVIDEPAYSGYVGPVSSKIYMIAFFIGLGVPVGIIFLIGVLKYRIETRGDVETLTTLPIIGDVPMTKDAQINPIVIHENRNEMMEEVFRSIRTNVQYLLQEGQKVILFTSTSSGEGKSFNAGNLATSFAFMGKKTVIVGLDIRRPGLNKVFKISRKADGISQYLSQPSTTDLMSLCQKSDVNENLYILPGGIVPPNPTELVARPSLDEAIAILKKNFDYIILDTAPIGMVTDTQLISRVADIVVYVCRSGYTPKRDLKLVNQLVSEGKLHQVGILINGIDMSNRSAGYYYGYGKYGRYGKYGHGKRYGYGYGYGYGKEK